MGHDSSDYAPNEYVVMLDLIIVFKAGGSFSCYEVRLLNFNKSIIVVEG